MADNPEILCTNVLIIGKSGAGKSSLLNYLFDRKLEETGVGKPVTEKGIFPHEYFLDSEMKIVVYDTWGLEADKADEWKELVRTEIEKHDALSIKDWFHTIIYCLNANSDRIEPFETEFISDLIKTGNNVVVVLTHSDLGRTKRTITGIKKALKEEGVGEDNIIEVSNESKKLIGGICTSRFGKEEVWEKIKQGLWKKIVEKLPKDLKRDAIESIEKAKTECYGLVDKQIKLATFHSNKKFNKLNEECNNVLNSCIDSIHEMYVDKVKEAVDFYVKIYNRFFEGEAHEHENTAFSPDNMIKYEMKKSDKIEEDVTYMLLMAIPGVNACIPFMIAGLKRDEYKEKIDEQVDKMISNLSKDEEALRNYLVKMLME